ncbi:hypothetical protein GCM10010492_16050 [Saccharothrix mutabilis subsp. mutabilis]|uniref:DUF6891 domain-containing protein n=1 Tax=Saccharothrix mutabilis subsp. mutabilis TaxID=66855 RepID=A0ABP3CZ61_9PSEU|nr:hypothetical protein GCM10017745_17680 [Saccharothrix mutabilis subsp. capreolus]
MRRVQNTNDKPLPEDVRAEAVEFALELVHGGFRSREEVVGDVLDHVEEALPESEVTALVDRLWAARVAEQAEWPATTDVDRLLAAFEELDVRGVVARADFACCRSCGIAEIGDEAGPGARGFVFFHQQDTVRAVAGGGLFLAYGSLPGSPDDTAAVGREVAGALRAAGLPVEWDGSPDTRILVEPLDWRLRLPVG